MNITYQYLMKIVSIARAAGDAIMEYYEHSALDVRVKADRSPVTEADLAADRIIREGLKNLAPGELIISEEALTEGDIRDQPGGRAWLVDPLDGTEGFVKRSPHKEFAVSIARLTSHRPDLGVIYLPAQDRLFFGGSSAGAYAQQPGGDVMPIKSERGPCKSLIVNRSCTIPPTFGNNPLTAQIAVLRMAAAGKFGMVASGQAGLYVRTGRTCEWDIAAGHAIVEASGGYLVDFAGRPIEYGKPGFLNPPFVAGSAGATDWRKIVEILLDPADLK